MNLSDSHTSILGYFGLRPFNKLTLIVSWQLSRPFRFGIWRKTKFCTSTRTRWNFLSFWASVRCSLVPVSVSLTTCKFRAPLPISHLTFWHLFFLPNLTHLTNGPPVTLKTISASGSSSYLRWYSFCRFLGTWIHLLSPSGSCTIQNLPVMGHRFCLFWFRCSCSLPKTKFTRASKGCKTLHSFCLSSAPAFLGAGDGDRRRQEVICWHGWWHTSTRLLPVFSPPRGQGSRSRVKGHPLPVSSSHLCNREPASHWPRLSSHNYKSLTLQVVQLVSKL